MRKGDNIFRRKDGRFEGRFKDPITSKYKYVYGKNYDEVFSKMPLSEQYFPQKINTTCSSFTIEEEQIIINQLLINDIYQPLNFAIYLSLKTGMHLDEICKLNWNQIDFKKMQFILKNRNIPLLDPILIKVLKEYANNKKSHYIFLTKNGNPIYSKAIQTYYNSFINGCNVPKLSFKSLRHTFAIHFLSLGGCINVLSKILGHTSTTHTVLLYQPLISDSQVLYQFKRFYVQSK